MKSAEFDCPFPLLNLNIIHHNGCRTIKCFVIEAKEIGNQTKLNCHQSEFYFDLQEELEQ